MNIIALGRTPGIERYLPTGKDTDQILSASLSWQGVQHIARRLTELGIQTLPHRYRLTIPGGNDRWFVALYYSGAEINITLP